MYNFKHATLFIFAHININDIMLINNIELL